ncbi:MAG: hypothetical protein U9Q83_07800 [Bacteroidota bacterium]|nr:hypothetical protein [Bacteroidota bacterium]
MELTYTSIAQVKKNYKQLWLLVGLFLTGILIVKYLDNQDTYEENK